MECCYPEIYRVKFLSFVPFTTVLLIFGPLTIMPITDKWKKENDWTTGTVIFISYALTFLFVFAINTLLCQLSCIQNYTVYRRCEENYGTIFICTWVILIDLISLIIGYGILEKFNVHYQSDSSAIMTLLYCGAGIGTIILLLLILGIIILFFKALLHLKKCTASFAGGNVTPPPPQTTITVSQ